MILRAEIDHGNRSFDHYSWLAKTYKVKVVGLSLVYLLLLALVAWLSISGDRIAGMLSAMSVSCVFAVHDRFQRMKEVQLLSHHAEADEGLRPDRGDPEAVLRRFGTRNEDRP